MKRRALSRKNLWDVAPPRLKAGIGLAARLVPQSLVLGRPFRRSLRFVAAAQWWPREKSRAYQLEHVRRVATVAYEKSAFYRERFQKAGLVPQDLLSLEALCALSPIDRQTVREHLDDMLTVDPSSRGIDYVSTGGTSGTPLHFLIEADRSSIEYAYLVAGWGRVGYDLDTPLAVIRGHLVPKNRMGFHHSYDPILRRHYFSNRHMTDEDMRWYVSRIAKMGPCFLLVYPSSITTLALFLRRSGLEAPRNVRGVLAGSENLYPEQRTLVEEVFGVRVFSWYGHTEKLILGAECESSHDYHIWPTYGYCELLAEDGSPVAEPGQIGELTGTGFINMATPFLRYRTGDHATYVGERCEKCGREGLVVREIRGHRTQEMIVARDGSLISWAGLNLHGEAFRRVQQFQFFQERPGIAVLRLVPGQGFDAGDERELLVYLRRTLQGQGDVTIALVDSIELSATGKGLYVDQRITPAERAGPMP
jgi:phenylacetate-coenzyme A ligase PaaK-like adenylate-forming protein